MRPVRPLLALALVATLPLAAAGQAPATTPVTVRPKPAQLAPDSLQQARRIVTWLYTSQTDSLFAHMDSTGQRELKSPKALEPMIAELAARAGTEQALIGERWVTRNGLRQYWRTATFSLIPEPFLVRLVLLPSGAVAGFGFGRASQAPPIDP